MKMKIMALGALCAAFLAACALNNPSISDSQIGLRNVDLLDDKDVVLKDINYTKEPAGMAKRFDRSFENAPPFIPHDTEGLVPITKDSNMCVTCTCLSLQKIAEQLRSQLLTFMTSEIKKILQVNLMMRDITAQLAMSSNKMA